MLPANSIGFSIESVPDKVNLIAGKKSPIPSIVNRDANIPELLNVDNNTKLDIEQVAKSCGLENLDAHGDSSDSSVSLDVSQTEEHASSHQVRDVHLEGDTCMASIVRL